MHVSSITKTHTQPFRYWTRMAGWCWQWCFKQMKMQVSRHEAGGLPRVMHFSFALSHCSLSVFGLHTRCWIITSACPNSELVRRFVLEANWADSPNHMLHDRKSLMTVGMFRNLWCHMYIEILSNLKKVMLAGLERRTCNSPHLFRSVAEESSP